MNFVLGGAIGDATRTLNIVSRQWARPVVVLLHQSSNDAMTCSIGS